MVVHSDDDLDRAGRRFEVLADSLDPDNAVVEVTDDLHQIAVVSDAVRVDEARLREAVHTARVHGRSWNEIAVSLGVSRQAARQRYLDKTPA